MNEDAATETMEPMTGTPAEIYSEEPDGGQQTTDGGQQTQETRAQQPQFPTAEQITASVREGLRQAQPEPAQRQWTKEELDKAFNVYNPSQEQIDALVAGGEPALKVMMAFRDGMQKQFGTLLQYSIEVAKQELLDQMHPAMTFAQEQAAAQDRENFFSENEDLRQFEKLTQTVFNALKAEGYQANTKEEAFKTLADRTRALIPQGNGAGAAPSGGARTTNPTQRRPAQLSSGSQAGGGGPSASPAPFAGAEIWS